MVEHRYVACKLHGLNAQWSEEKKQSYIRHAIREYNIHKSLVHHHIVRLWDIFEIDQNTFCTILEYCSGTQAPQPFGTDDLLLLILMWNLNFIYFTMCASHSLVL